jgi:hypothetical protein
MAPWNETGFGVSEACQITCMLLHRSAHNGILAVAESFGEAQ